MSGRHRSGFVLLLTVVAAAYVTGLAFDEPPGSLRFIRLTYVLAAVLLGGALLSGGYPRDHRSGRHPLAIPALRAVALFVGFVILGWVARAFSPVRHGVDTLLAYADAYRFWTVAVAAAVAGAAEEVFYRGAVWERSHVPLVASTFAHVLTTLPAGNVALTLSAFVLGGVLGHSRRRTGGWWAPAMTHALWAILVVAWLPR